MRTSFLYFGVRVRCRLKKFTFAISSPDEFLATSLLSSFLMLSYLFTSLLV